jgi:hypothetical protein
LHGSALLWIAFIVPNSGRLQESSADAVNGDALEPDEFRRCDAGVFDLEAKSNGFLDAVEELVE